MFAVSSSSPELWLSSSDLHPGVHSGVKISAFGRAGVTSGVDVIAARLMAATRLASLGITKNINLPIGSLTLNEFLVKNQ